MDRIAAGAGWIGMLPCPGRGAPGALARDMAAIRGVGARHLLTLLPDDELARLGVPGLGAAAAAAGLAWHQAPLTDFAAPGPAWEAAWAAIAPALHACLDAGGGVAVHCRAGLGRTGTVAARLLAERGLPPAAAVAAVRRARPGAIETPGQLAWVLAFSAAG